MTTVGVTGHRVLNDIETITREIDAALTQIREGFPAPFAVYSALAEGGSPGSPARLRSVGGQLDGRLAAAAGGLHG